MCFAELVVALYSFALNSLCPSTLRALPGQPQHLMLKGTASPLPLLSGSMAARFVRAAAGEGGAFVFFCAAEAQARVGCHVFLLCGERV